jgi:hypothetical protein
LGFTLMPGTSCRSWRSEVASRASTRSESSTETLTPTADDGASPREAATTTCSRTGAWARVTSSRASVAPTWTSGEVAIVNPGTRLSIR